MAFKDKETEAKWRSGYYKKTGYWKRLRKAALIVLGDKCVRCGFDDDRALQIDHVNGGGRADHVKRGPRAIYKEALSNPGSGKYQILCANCNWIKRAENNENPTRS